ELERTALAIRIPARARSKPGSKLACLLIEVAGHVPIFGSTVLEEHVADVADGRRFEDGWHLANRRGGHDQTEPRTGVLTRPGGYRPAPEPRLVASLQVHDVRDTHIALVRVDAGVQHEDCAGTEIRLHVVPQVLQIPDVGRRLAGVVQEQTIRMVPDRVAVDFGRHLGEWSGRIAR